MGRRRCDPNNKQRAGKLEPASWVHGGVAAASAKIGASSSIWAMQADARAAHHGKVDADGSAIARNRPSDAA